MRRSVYCASPLLCGDREDDKKQFERLCASLAPGIAYFTDGSSKTNPGPAGAGIYQPAYNNIPILFKSTSLGNATNNDAELMALHESTECALDIISQLSPNDCVYFFIDSTITIKIGLGYIKCKSHPTIGKEIVDNIKDIAQYNNVLLIWAPGHAKIMGNEIADYLAKRGADEITSTDRPPDKFLCSVNFLNSIS